MKLTNTLTGKKEEFIPIKDGAVGMYHCGPTVYDHAHIGNLRAYIFADTLRRSLEYVGYEVKQVINITDIGHLSSDADDGEDKMTKALKRDKKPITLEAMRKLANFYFNSFKEDLEKLNIKKPDQFPFASEHIKEDIDLIETLFKKEFAYKTSDGIYFDTSKDSNYGKLGGKSSDTEEHSRVEHNPEKRNHRDFALWKFNEDLGFPSPFGKGFPGWHIECSAMSMKYLGETFDIHTGGIDHIPVHHNNEIAQSENATDKKFVNFWLHSAFIKMEGGKMAKSQGEKILLKTLIERNINPIIYRFWILQAKYSTPIDFSWSSLESARTGFEKLVRNVKNLDGSGNVNPQYLEKFKSFIEDDLNTPEGIALLWELLKDNNVSDADKKTTILEFDKVLGLNLDNVEIPEEYLDTDKLPEEIKKIIEEREKARKEKDWAKSDSLRETIKSKGFGIEDSPQGTKVFKI